MSLALVLGSAQPSHPDAGSSQAQEGIGALRSPLTRDQWFVQHVLACEPRLMAYLRRHVRDLPNAEEVVDLRQEVYVRVYEAAAHVVPEHTAAFVLTTARHLLIDRFRRADLVPMSSLDDTDLGEFASPAPSTGRKAGVEAFDRGHAGSARRMPSGRDDATSGVLVTARRRTAAGHC